MPVVQLRQGLNTFPTSVTGGATPDANRIIDVSEWATALEPRKTPLLTMVGIGDAYDQRPHYWGQSQRVALETNYTADMTNNQTTISLTTGTGVLTQKWSVIELIDFAVGSTTVLDQSTREIVIRTDDAATDTPTIVRGQSGTSGVTHVNGGKAFIIGTAEPENSSHSLSPITRGFQFFNYFQRFEGGVSADKAAQAMPTWEHPDNPMLSDFREEQLRLKVLLEMALWRGGRQAGDVATPLPATMGGLDTFLATNVLNMAGAKLTPRILESELRDLAKHTDGGPEGIMLLMSYDTAAIWDMLIDPIRMATADTTTLSMYTERVKFRFGTYEIGVSHNARNGVIYGIRKENLKVHPFKTLNWHVAKKEGSVHAVDRDEMYVSGDFTFVVQKEASMFKMWNFVEDLSQYEGYNVFAQ
jgi:hypothetical protein